MEIMTKMTTVKERMDMKHTIQIPVSRMCITISRISHHDNHVHYHTCDNCKGVVNDLIEQVKGMESQVSGLNTNIKTIMHKHASNYPVGTVVDDESGVGMRPSEENFSSEVIHPHASDGTADAHTVIEKLDKLANSMKDEIKKHKDSQKVPGSRVSKTRQRKRRNPKCIPISGGKALGCRNDNFVASIADGHNFEDFKTSTLKIGSLLTSIKSIVPQELKEKYTKSAFQNLKCLYATPFLPRCNGKCQPLKMCESELLKT